MAPAAFSGKCDFVYESEGKCRDVLLPATEEEANEVVSLEFPPGFRFGAATSAYQVEGGIVDTNWNRWEEMKVRPDGKETVRPNADGTIGAGRATDMWNLFESVDLPMIKQLGLSTFRFSVEWSRVQPKRHVFDHDAIARYARWCRLLRAEGIEPMVTLLHFTEPGWFEDLGGWESAHAADAFGEFARFTAPRLAPHCAYWCTLNEPVGTVLNGWLQGIHPPGKTGQVRTVFKVLYNQLLAHKQAADAIGAAFEGLHAAPRLPPTVLVANNVLWFEADPERSGRWGLLSWIAWSANILINYAMMDALVFGRLPNFPLPLDSVAWLVGARPGLRSLKGTVNACGVNNYVRVWFKLQLSALLGWFSGREVVRTKSGGQAVHKGPPFEMGRGADGTASHRLDEGAAGDVISGEQAVGGGLLQGDPHDPRFEMSDMGWDLCPSTLGVVIDCFWRRYRLPILVTESGTADGDVHDKRRVRYLSGCLRAVHRAIGRGADVRAYMYWSYQDNFEWAEGYRPRFGLCRVDYDTLERKPTGGFKLYQQVISRHRERMRSTSAQAVPEAAPPRRRSASPAASRKSA